MRVIRVESLTNKTALASLDMEARATVQLGRIREVDPTADFLQIPSGQKVDISIELLDDQDRIQKHENTATALIRLDSVELYVNHLECEKLKKSKKQAGANSDASPVGAAATDDDRCKPAENSEGDAPGGRLTHYRANAANGTFHFPELIVTQSPGTLQALEFKITGLDDNRIPRPFLDQPRR